MLAGQPLHDRGGGAVAIRQVKVCQHDVARVVQQYVLRFQVSVDETQKMQILQCYQHLQASGASVQAWAYSRSPGTVCTDVTEAPTDCSLSHGRA